MDDKSSTPVTRLADARRSGKPKERQIVLVLQGGGALGAYQAGVYHALHEAGLEPDWVGGVSIGAINAAIIAGNEPQDRVARLRQFWTQITEDSFPYPLPWFTKWMKPDLSQHQLLDFASTLRTLTTGIPEFFQPRGISPWLQP